MEFILLNAPFSIYVCTLSVVIQHNIKHK